VLRVRPNMIDKERAKDPILESRMQQISTYLERNDYERRQRRIVYGRYKWQRPTGEKCKERNPLKNKPLHRILDQLNEESI